MKIVESQMKRAFRGHGDLVRTGRIALSEKDCDFNVSLMLAYIQQAGGFVAREFGLWSMTSGWNVAFRDSPCSASDGVHGPYLFRPVDEMWRSRNRRVASINAYAEKASLAQPSQESSPG
jgi:hypothetical protein